MVKNIRQFHLYSGLLFAPAVLFFALSGALQTFGLHEEQNGAAPSAWIAVIAEVHKNQRILNKTEPTSTAVAPTADLVNVIKNPEGKEPDSRSPKRPKSLPLQIFFAIVSIGLVASVFSGIYMAFAYKRQQKLIWACLVAGTVFPIAFLYF